MTIASKSVRRSYYYYYYPYYYYYKEKERKVNFRTRFFLMLANEFLAFEHSPLFFVDIIIHCSLLRTCRVRVEEKEEFLVYTVLWTLTCHPYLESATALSDKEKERKVNFRTRFFLMLANEFLAFEHSPLFFVDIIIHCSLLRTCRVRVEEKEEFLVYTVLWTLTCHPYLESANALSDIPCMQIANVLHFILLWRVKDPLPLRTQQNCAFDGNFMLDNDIYRLSVQVTSLSLPSESN